MPRCPGTTRDGRRCSVIVKPPQTHCYQHDPDRAEERRRNAARAGRSTGSREIRDLKLRISGVVDDVLKGSVDRGRAAVAIQGLNALRGALELERKVKETEELEERIEELERTQGGGQAVGLKNRVKRLEREAEPLVLVCVECGQTFRVPEDPYLRILVHGWRRATGQPHEDPLAERLEGHALAWRDTGEPLPPGPPEGPWIVAYDDAGVKKEGGCEAWD